MQTKEIKPIVSLCFTTETTMNDMLKYVRVKANELHRSAIENNLEVTGPVYWVYHGMDGNPATRFTLEICVPVFVAEKYSGPFEIKHLPSFTSATEIHQGAWELMPQTYQKLIGEILQNGKTMTGTCREMYINMDFKNPENNITEIQIGIN